MTAQTIQAFDHRQPIIVDPSEIRPGDWMRDLGTLRQVESVQATANQRAQGTLAAVRFVGGVDGRYGTLSVPEGVKVTCGVRLSRRPETAVYDLEVVIRRGPLHVPGIAAEERVKESIESALAASRLPTASREPQRNAHLWTTSPRLASTVTPKPSARSS
jgi:hypothetical protein